MVADAMLLAAGKFRTESDLLGSKEVPEEAGGI